MTPQETINLKVGDEFYVVVMSRGYELRNPFIRTCKSGKSTYYKPLGIFKTKVIEIDDKHENVGGKYGPSYYISGKLDTSEFKHLIWEGRWDELPEKKYTFDYTGYPWFTDSFYANFQNPFGDNNSTTNAFFTEAEAKEYYNKEMKKFKKNMKMYMGRLQNEIDQAYNDIEEANREIEKYTKLI